MVDKLNTKQVVSLRKAYGNALVELGQVNKNIVVLDADVSASTQSCMFAKEFPNQFFNCGISEQDVLCTAAGLSLTGKIPFVSAFSIFITGRGYDQIRNTICHSNLNVKIVGTHGGITVGEDGATHQALEDISLMRSIPNMRVIVPADSWEVKAAVKYVANEYGPFYIRIPRIDLPDIFDKNYKFNLEPQILSTGTDVSIVTNGDTLTEVLKAKELLKNNGINVQVIHCPVIKPTPVNLLNIITSNKVITVEDHSIIGGLGSVVAELIAESDKNIRLKRIGINDMFGQSGTSSELLDYYGLSANKIQLSTLNFLNQHK